MIIQPYQSRIDSDIECWPHDAAEHPVPPLPRHRAATCSPTATRYRRRTSSTSPTRACCSARRSAPPRCARARGPRCSPGSAPTRPACSASPTAATGSRHPERHIVHVLRDAGYWSGLIGEQHVSADPADVGYDHVVDLDSTKVRDVAPAATRLIAERARVGHSRSSCRSASSRPTASTSSRRPCATRSYSRPPENIVDTREHAARHGVVQGQRPVARPGRRHGAQRARGARARRQHAGHPDHRPRPGLSRRRRRRCTTAASA